MRAASVAVTSPAAGAALPLQFARRPWIAAVLLGGAAAATDAEARADLTAPWTPAPAAASAVAPAAADVPLWSPAPIAGTVAVPGGMRPIRADRLPLFGGAPPLAPGPTPAAFAPPGPAFPPATRYAAPPAPAPPADGFPAGLYGRPPFDPGVPFAPPGPPGGPYCPSAAGPQFPPVSVVPPPYEPVPVDLIPPPPAVAGIDPGRPYGQPTPGGLELPRLANWTPSVRLDTPTSAALLDFQNRQSDKQLTLLGSLPNAFPAGAVPHPVVVPAVQMRLSGLYGRTNTKDKFGYLGRFPPDFNSRTATDLRILQANLAATAYFTPWAAGYAETLFSDVFTFPTFQQGSFQVRQAYAVFGQPTEFPLYAFIGKKNVSYGDFGTLSPFTQALPWHYFAALGEGAGVGYVSGGFHAVLTGLAGGRGIRVSDSPDDGHVNNFAVNTHYAGRTGRFEYLVGAGYLHGTIYDADVPEHIRNDLFGPLNGAGDLNATLRTGPWTFAGEYVKTLADWPVTNFPVSAWKAEGAYDLLAAGAPLRLSVSWSEGKQAPTGLEFDRNDQLVLGAGWQPNPNALLSVEYVRSIGFAPLIGLTAPGVSERDVRQNSLVLGVSLVL